jgi:hypothetical protein
LEAFWEVQEEREALVVVVQEGQVVLELVVNWVVPAVEELA